MRVRVAAVALALLAGCVSQVQRARDLVAAGQRDAAVELLEATLREDPHEVDARLELARLRAEAGDLVRAEAQLRHAVEAAPARTDVRLELAGVLEALGSLPQAAHQLGEVRRRHGAAAVPDDRYRDLLTRAAARLRGQGDYAGAIAQYRRLQEDELVPAEGLAEDLESAWAAEAARLAGEGSRDAALAAWEEAEALDERDPDYPYARGKLLADMERHLDARTAFEEFLRRAATTPEAHAAAAERVGRWYAAREEHAHAVPYYEEAARLAPGEPRLLLTLAELHLKQGQTRPAEVTFSRYAAARGETAETFWSLGERARSLGARRLAERYLRRAWELSSGDFDVASGLAGLLAARGAREEAVRVMEAFMDAAVERAQAAFQVASWAAGRDDSVLAIRAYEESVRLNPDRTIVFLRLSDLYRSVGRPADADRALDRYVDASSDKATAHLTVAERLRIERRWDPAAAHIRRAIALRPKDPQPHRALARVHRAAERPEDEERAIETLVSVTPDTGTVLLEIGMDYRRRGDTVRAIRFLSRAADADGPLDKRRRALYLLGKVHLTLGDLEQMKTTDERYLALAPDESVHIRALESLARRYRKAHLTDQYLWALGEQVRLQPERAELYLRLGRLHLQRNDRDSATAAFRRFVSRSEDPVEALREVAGAYQKAGDFDAALATFRRIRDVAPGDLRYLRYTADLYRSRDADGDRERAAALYDKLLASPAAPEMELALIGHELYEGRYFPQAARAYELLLGDDELTDVYAFELAVCYLQTGRLDRAAEVFESWLSGRGHDASSHLEVARQYKGVGRYEEAQAHYDKVLDLGGSEVDEAFAEAADLLVRRAETDALRRLVRVYLEHARNELRAREQAAQQLALAGLREEAVAEWRRVLALRPNHGTALTKLADLLWAMGRAEEAAAYVARLIEETGGQARNWLEAAKALKQRGAYAMALEFYDRAHAGGAREHETLVPRGEILLALGRWDEARAAFDAALAVARSQRSLLEKIGDLWEQHGRHDEALAVWQRAVTVDPKHPEHYGRLVALLLRGGEVQRARRTVLAARAHAPASLFPVGRQFEVAGHARYAAALYDEVLESGIGAHAKEAFERLAALRLAEGRRQALGPAIQRFVTGARSRAGAHRLVARLFADAARPEDAFAHARLSLREEAKDEVHEEAVRYALLAGREEEALRTAVRRVEHAETPNDATLEALADLQARGRPDLAADLAGRLEARRLSSGVTGRALVALRLAAGDTAGALAVAQRFLEGHDDPVTARRELASLLDDRGLSAEAAALLEAAVAMSEAPAAVLEELARVYLDAGDVAAGTAALRRYVEARRGDETEAEVALEAGALLQGAGRFREAAESLRVALTHPEAGRARVAYRLLLLALLAAEEPTARLREASAAFLAARADTRKAYEVALRTLLDLHLLDLARALVREGLARFPGAGSLVEQRVIVDTLGGDDEDLPASVDAFLNAAEGQDRQSRSTDLTTFFERRLRFEQAARVWARRAQQAPGAGPLRYQEARARLLGGDTAGGKAALEPWLSEAPEPAQAALQAAQLHLEVADGPAAAGHATRAVELAADDPRGWYVLGVARLVAHDAAGAEEALRRYVTLAPEAGRARLHGARRLLYGGEAPRPGGALVTDPATARRVLALLRAEAPADEAPPAQLLEAELWREAARVLAGEPGAAEALERRVAATPASLLPDPISVPGLDPGEPPPTPDLLAADVLLARGAADAADRVLLRAVRTAERPDRVLGDVFSLCRERGATELMSRWLDRLDRWFPDNPYTVTWLAEILETTGDEEGAEAAYRQALAREPRAGVYMNNLAYLFARRGRDLPEALALVRKAMRLSPASNKYYLDTEGWVLYRMGKLRQARQRILESIWLMDVQTGGAVGESFYHLGMVARDQGDREAARAAFWKAATWDRHGEYGRKSRKELEALAGGGED